MLRHDSDNTSRVARPTLAQVSSADHETEEGYFSLGTDATVLAKPGTELQRFLARQNGRKVRITLTLVGAEQLQKLER